MKCYNFILSISVNISLFIYRSRCIILIHPMQKACYRDERPKSMYICTFLL